MNNTRSNPSAPPNSQESVHGRRFLVANAVAQNAFEMKVAEVDYWMNWMISDDDLDFGLHCCHWCYSSLNSTGWRDWKRGNGTIHLVQLDLGYSE
jgi:hypothetical protein